MEVPWHPTVLNMLADTPYQSPIIKDVMRDVSLDWVLRVSYCCINHLAAQRHVCIDKGSLPVVEGATLNIYNKSLPAMFERMGRLMCYRWCTKQCYYILGARKSYSLTGNHISKIVQYPLYT